MARIQFLHQSLQLAVAAGMPRLEGLEVVVLAVQAEEESGPLVEMARLGRAMQEDPVLPEAHHIMPAAAAAALAPLVVRLHLQLAATVAQADPQALQEVF
jgi:hypothetical protein